MIGHVRSTVWGQRGIGTSGRRVGYKGANKLPKARNLKKHVGRSRGQNKAPRNPVSLLASPPTTAVSPGKQVPLIPCNSSKGSPQQPNIKADLSKSCSRAPGNGDSTTYLSMLGCKCHWLLLLTGAAPDPRDNSGRTGEVGRH